MASVMVSPASCLMALVTSSLVSRVATPGSNGTSQARIAASTWPRASAAAAGPAVSRTRRECSSVGRVGALVFIGLLRGFELVRKSAGHAAQLFRGRSEQYGYSAACMTNDAASCTVRHRSADGFRRTGTERRYPGAFRRRGKLRNRGPDGPVTPPCAPVPAGSPAGNSVPSGLPWRRRRMTAHCRFRRAPSTSLSAGIRLVTGWDEGAGPARRWTYLSQQVGGRADSARRMFRGPRSALPDRGGTPGLTHFGPGGSLCRPAMALRMIRSTNSASICSRENQRR